VVTTYETIKTETINLFNGNTFKKLFFSSDDNANEELQSNNDDAIAILAARVKELERTIQASKDYIRSIIEKIRYQGKIKIVNKLNDNPRHPEYQSSFPDLLNATPKKPKNEDEFYPFVRFDENFDLEGRKNISKMDQNFKNRINKYLEESYYNDFISNGEWKVSDQLNSFHNIRSTIKIFQENYQYLKTSNQLDKSFMNDSNASLFIINNSWIPINDRKKMIESFKQIIPNPESQKLISTYANQKFLHQSYLQLISEHPEIDQYKTKNSRNIYRINFLDDGSIKLVATNFSDLDINNDNYVQKYKSFGIRATIVFPPNNAPIMKYSHFIK